MNEAQFLHRTHEVGQRRLARLNQLTNQSFFDLLPRITTAKPHGSLERTVGT